jgi:hypothetical protein
VTQPRIDHVVWCVRRESLPDLQEYWTDALGVPLVSSYLEDLGLHLLMSWEAGVEIVAPAVEPGSFTPALEAFLESNGEGVFSTVYEVDDLDSAVKNALAQGSTVSFEDVIEAETLAHRLHWPPHRQSYRLHQVGLVERFGTTVVLQQSTPA